MPKSKVLFICTHNSARSQMAEEFLNHMSPDRFQASSAGLEPTEVNPLVIEVMAEIGLDLSGKNTTSVFDLYRQGKLFDYVITVCDEAGEAGCPIFPGVTHRLRLPFPDPAEAKGTHKEQLAQIREIRDAIKDKLKEFTAWVDNGAAPSSLGDRWEVVA